MQEIHNGAFVRDDKHALAFVFRKYVGKSLRHSPLHLFKTLAAYSALRSILFFKGQCPIGTAGRLNGRVIGSFFIPLAAVYFAQPLINGNLLSQKGANDARGFSGATDGRRNDNVNASLRLDEPRRGLCLPSSLPCERKRVRKVIENMLHILYAFPMPQKYQLSYLLSAPSPEFINGADCLVRLAPLAPPHRYRRAPVATARNRPVFCFREPVAEPVFPHFFGNPRDAFILFHQPVTHLAYFHKPRRRRKVEERRVAAPTVRIVVGVGFPLQKLALCLKCVRDFLIGFPGVLFGLCRKTRKWAGFFCEGTVSIHMLNKRQFFFDRKFQVIFTERGSDVYDAGPVLFGHEVSLIDSPSVFEVQPLSRFEVEPL